MELFTKLFGAWLVFVYHCFDRIVLSGYLMGLQRPGQVVYWLQQVLGIEAITKEVLSRRTEDYVRLGPELCPQPARFRWNGPKRTCARKTTSARICGGWNATTASASTSSSRPWNTAGRSARGRLVARKPGGPADYPILHRHRSRYRYYYFYLRDEVLGPMIVRMGTFIPFEASYYLNGHHISNGNCVARGVGFRKDDNAFLSRGRPRQRCRPRPTDYSGELIQKRLNYWTVLLGPKFSERDRRRAKLERSYYVHQVEYCQNFVFSAIIPSGDLRAQLRTGIVAHDGGADLARLRARSSRPDQGQTADHHGADRARPARVPRLLETRLGQAYEKYPDVSAQRSHFEQSAGFQAAKGWRIWARCGRGYCRCWTVLPANRRKTSTCMRTSRCCADRAAGGARRVRTAGIRIQDARMIRLLEVRVPQLRKLPATSAGALCLTGVLGLGIAPVLAYSLSWAKSRLQKHLHPISGKAENCM